MFENDREKAQNLLVMLKKFEIINLSKKIEKKDLEKKVKEENFSCEIRLRIYDVEKIKQEGKEW